MGMTIDKTIEFFNGLECHTPQAKDARDVAVDTMRKYQMMQADYEVRLKADLKAILVDLKLEIEECVDGAEGSPQFEQGVDIARCQVIDIIQEKINVLKAESEDDDNT